MAGKKVLSTKSKNHNFNPIIVKPKVEKEPEYDQIISYDNPEVVLEMEKQWPEMTAEFKRIMFTQYELFCLKQSNYGPDNISVGSNLETEQEKKVSLTGLWFRMNDKIQRLKQLVVLGKQDNIGESCEDTFQDLSVYGIIAQLVSSGKWAK
jgi:hypothetical protein|tara:strand:- start:524 stop:976 length:453 start_codon:yes stop_codon:yes gene_type:complete